VNIGPVIDHLLDLGSPLGRIGSTLVLGRSASQVSAFPTHESVRLLTRKLHVWRHHHELVKRELEQQS
jgi:hypothetical protein